MRNWSNKQHEETLRLKKEKKRLISFSKQLNLQNTLPTTVYLDNNNEISTAIYTNDGVNYYDGNGNKINIRGI